MNQKKLQEQLKQHRKLETEEEIKLFWEKQQQLINNESQEEIAKTLSLIQDEIKQIRKKAEKKTLE